MTATATASPHVSEAALEASLRATVRLAGGATFKLAPITKGMPDRLVIFPPGRIYLVELKTETGRLSPAQEVWHERMAELGVHVHVLYGRDDIRRWVRERVREFDDPDTTLTRGYRRWSTEEDQLVMEQRMDDTALSARIDRSVSSIRNRRRYLRTRDSTTN